MMRQETSIVHAFVERARRQRALHRALAFLCVLVLLFTTNAIKFHADTLERVPDCGYPDHVHDESCYQDGELVCALHVHTDACYQTRPVAEVHDFLEEAEDDEASEESFVDADEEYVALEEAGIDLEDIDVEPEEGRAEERTCMLGDAPEDEGPEAAVLPAAEEVVVALEDAVAAEADGEEQLSRIAEESEVEEIAQDDPEMEEAEDTAEAPEADLPEALTAPVAVEPGSPETPEAERLEGEAKQDSDEPSAEAQAGDVEAENTRPEEPQPENELEENPSEEILPEDDQPEGEPEEGDQSEDAQTENAQPKDEPGENPSEENQSEENPSEDGESEAESPETDAQPEEGEPSDDEPSDGDLPEDGEASEDAEQPEADAQPGGDLPVAGVVRAASIELDEVPLSLSAMMAQAVPAEADDTDEAPAAEAEIPAEDGETSGAEEEGPAEADEPADAAEPVSPSDWQLEYDETLLAVEYTGEDYSVMPIAGFENTVITVRAGDTYVLTLGAWEAEAAPEPLEEAQPAAEPLPEESAKLAGTRHVAVEGADYALDIDVPEEANLPAGAEFAAVAVDSGLYGDAALAAVDAREDAPLRLLALFDLTIYDGDAVIQPDAPLEIRIRFGGDVARDARVYAVHFPGTGAQPAAPRQRKAAKLAPSALPAAELLPAAREGADVRFTAAAFSVYAVVGTTLETTVLASDGNAYSITATYGPETGIPADAQLRVTELAPDAPGYADYVAGSECALSLDRGGAAYIRLFDIKIVDGQDADRVHQPAPGTAVDVRVRLADSEGESMRVVHFAEAGSAGSVVEATTEGNTVTFEAEGFSVYTIVASGQTTNLDGKSFAIGNDNTHNFLMAVPQDNKLKATNYSVTGDTVITGSVDDVTRWTFTSAPNGGNWYYISDGNGNYLNIGNGNNSYVTVSSVPQAIYVRTNGNTVRLQRATQNNSTAVNNYGGTTDGGFGPYNDQGNNEWFKLYNIATVEDGLVGVYTYVAAAQWKNNPEFMELIGVGYTDPYDYFPAGVVYLPASFFNGKTDFGALIQTQEDWQVVVEALRNIDTNKLSGDGAPNQGNHIGEFADQAIGDLGQRASSQHTALFSNTGHAGYADLGYGFHLDLRFEANRITFLTGNNGLTNGSFGNARDGTQVDTRLYIPGSIIQEPRNLVIPSGYRFMGYYTDPNFTIPWDGIGTPLNEDQVVYIKITAESNVILNYRPVPGNAAGSLTLYEEGLNPVNGTATGSTATPNPGYTFAGWYADEDCTQLLTTDATYVPTKAAGERWVDGTTYYAKFVENTVTLTFVAEENVDRLEMVDVPEDVVSYEYSADRKTLTVVVNAVTGSPVTVKGVAADGYAIKEWTIDGRTGALTSADDVTTAKGDDPAATDLWTDRTYRVCAEVLKTITVTKEVKIVGKLDPQDVNVTVYFALKDLSRDPAPWVTNADGSIYTVSIPIVNGVPQGTAQFVDLPAGTYEVWEVADANAGALNPGATIAEGIVVSRIQTWISDTDTGNDVEVTNAVPNGAIKVINTLNHAGEAMNFWANKKWFPEKNAYTDPNAVPNVNVPAEAWVDFTLYRVYENGSEEEVQTIRLDGAANAEGEEAPWAAAFRDLPAVDDNLRPVSYYVKETAMADLSAFDYYTTFNDTTSTNGGSIANVVAYGNVAVTKEIELPANISEADKAAFLDALTITVTGPAEVPEGRRVTRTLDRNSFVVAESTRTVTYGATQQVTVLTLTASANDLPAGTYTVSEAGYDAASLAYRWDAAHSWIKADKLPAGQSALVNREQTGETSVVVPVGVNVTDTNVTTRVGLRNSYVVQDIRATKVWDDLGAANANHPSVSLTLYRTDAGGSRAAVSTLIIGANQTGENLTVTWPNQPQNYAYSVEEAEVRGYELLSIAGDAAQGFIVTNRRAAVLKIVKTDQEGRALAGATFRGDRITGTVTTAVTGEGSDAEAIILEDYAVPLGAYTLTEESAPLGFNPLEGPVEIQVAATDAGELTVTATINGQDSPFARVERVDVNDPSKGWILRIRNDSGVTLPSAGGPGTTPYTLLGGLMIALAAWLLVRKRSA